MSESQPKLLIHKPRSFLYLAGPYVFYVIYDTVLRIEDNGYYYYYCDEIPGCDGTHGFRANCTICMVTRFYCLNELNQINNIPLKLLEYAEMLFEDLKEICDYDATISQLWMKDYGFRFVDSREGTTFGISLYDCIDSYFRD